MARSESSFFFLLLLLLPASACAWGLSSELNQSWAPARLVFPILKEKEIRFCIHNGEPARFDSAGMALQVESALRLWLLPLEEIGVKGVKILEVGCEAGNPHLVVEIGPENQWPGLGSYQLSVQEGDRFYSRVKFDSGFGSQVGGETYPILDFSDFAKEGGLADLLTEVSLRHPATVGSFAVSHNARYFSVFWSTFPSLIHELGHSFGLCDTYDAPIKDQCDPAFSSNSQPSSVMKDSTYFFLTDDDVTGIRALFRRFRK
jgi:hypothetical protein